MKTYKKIIVGCVLLWSTAGCNSMKTRNRLETSASSIENTREREVAVQKQTAIRQITLQDSSDANYKVVIFPLDSFQFSLQDGFKGKATKLEVIGSIVRRRLVQDSTNVSSIDSTIRDVEAGKKSKSSFKSDDKFVDRSRLDWRLTIALLGIAALAGWRLWKKFN